MPILSPPIDPLMDFIDDMDKLSQEQSVTISLSELNSEADAKQYRMELEWNVTLCKVAKVKSTTLWAHVEGLNLQCKSISYHQVISVLR